MFSASEWTTVVVADRASSLALAWYEALAMLSVRHPNGRSRVLLTIVDDVLKIALDETLDTRDMRTPMRSPFVISCVRLACWPGADRARQWFAAGWAGYCVHEALELVTFGGRAVIDPHADPYPNALGNRGLRDGFPAVLTEETLSRAMTVIA